MYGNRTGWADALEAVGDLSKVHTPFSFVSKEIVLVEIGEDRRIRAKKPGYYQCVDRYGGCSQIVCELFG